MKKRILIIAMVLLLAVGACFSLVGCKSNDANTLNIVVLNAGYGDSWINALAEKFKADHPGYNVNIEATASAKSVINSNLYSRNNFDDLYISVGADWMAYAKEGLFAPLDDILDDQVDGVTLKDKIRSEYKDSIYYPNADGNLQTYRLPWIAATGGIFYNEKMFNENGWEIPTTYDELITLCNDIIDANLYVETASGAEKVKPFIYTSDNPDYFDYTVYTWWAQLAGESAINEFLKYESASNYNAETNATYGKLKQATKMWYDLFSNENYYTSNKTNHNAQQDFCNGKAAMMFNADWMYNEISKYDISNERFQLKLMKTPVATGAIEDSILYTVGEDQYIAIPECSIKKDLAKDFIKLMVSDYGCKTFLKEAKGVLAYNCAFTDEDLTDPFLANLIEVRDGYDKTFTNFPTLEGGVAGTTKMLYLNSKIDIWGTSALRPYSKLLNGSKDLNGAFSDISTQISADWEKFKQQSNI